ncbi:MAG: LUD domain-containing protein [Pirellulales bacterium]|nr:LUD domain-containing protein [Pirellulales bacterium]
MTPNSRDVVLNRIRQALADRPEAELPAAPEVWPSTNPDVESMVQRFAEEFDALDGELYRLGSIDEARAKLRELVDGLDGATLGVVDRPLPRDLTQGLAPERIAWAADAGTPREMARLGAGLIEAEALLADTGSCVVACGTAEERLMCYVVPTCIVVARPSQLREHLPAAWGELGPRAADPALRGELVLLTGPSRTSDIEKILILGVHGPKRLVVLLVQ